MKKEEIERKKLSLMFNEEKMKNDVLLIENTILNNKNQSQLKEIEYFSRQTQENENLKNQNQECLKEVENLKNQNAELQKEIEYLKEKKDLMDVYFSKEYEELHSKRLELDCLKEQLLNEEIKGQNRLNEIEVLKVKVYHL